MQTGCDERVRDGGVGEGHGGAREIIMVGSGARRQGNGPSTEIPALASRRVDG
jgi:hypothetical protein